MHCDYIILLRSALQAHPTIPTCSTVTKLFLQLFYRIAAREVNEQISWYKISVIFMQVHIYFNETSLFILDTLLNALLANI